MGKRNGNGKRSGFIYPMLCKSVRELPRGNEWLYEVKRGGQRGIVVKDGRQVTVFAENGRSLEFPDVEQAVRKADPDSAVFDGEIIALDATGRQCDPRQVSDCQFQLYAWDLLHLDGRDLTDQPIERRKAQLCMATLDSELLFSPSLNCEPEQLVEEVRILSLEGVLAKRKGSVYEPGQRSGAWVRLRVQDRVRTPRARGRRAQRLLQVAVD